MFKVVGADNHEYGPVSADQVRQWLAEGRVDAQTKVQREGTADWKLIAELPEFAASFRLSGPWTCPKCGERLEAQFDSCWRCSTRRPGLAAAALAAAASPAGQDEEPPSAKRTSWRVEYHMFRGTLATWDELFQQAAAFASDIGRERLISISHSEDDNDGVIAVWYWTQAVPEEPSEASPPPQPPAPDTPA